MEVSSGRLLATDSGACPTLILLDLSSAFNTVNRDILLNCLDNYVGIRHTSLAWCCSYLADRSFSVALREFFSSSAPLACVVPQGSILGHLLFSINMLTLGFHCHANDTQLYVPLANSNN